MARVHPIVGVLREQGRSQTWLARRIGRSHAYVNRTLNGLHPAVPGFRAACAEALAVGEDELFHDGSHTPPRRKAESRRDGAAVRGLCAEGAVVSTPQEAPLERSA
jgi:hypothetical protein